MEVAINADSIRGHTETIILAHLIKGDSYGYEINKSILEKTNQNYELKEATLYSALRRLEQFGYIESYWGNENTGARRRYYKISEAGKRRLQTNRKEWKETKEIVNKLIL